MTQPEALRLADELEMWTLGEPAANELRRLHEVNQEMLEALRLILDYHTTSKPWHAKDGDMSVWIRSAQVAIAKATGESK